jgi:hypothetical protein
MNPRILFAGTVAFALLSSVAFAQEAKPLTRAEVLAEYSRAAADGTLHRTDYDDVARDSAAASSRTRAQVVDEMTAARQSNTLIGPMRNRSYNGYGTETLRAPTVARSDVKAQVAGALHDGSLRRSDYDDVPVTVSRRVSRERAGRNPA